MPRYTSRVKFRHINTSSKAPCLWALRPNCFERHTYGRREHQETNHAHLAHDEVVALRCAFPLLTLLLGIVWIAWSVHRVCANTRVVHFLKNYFVFFRGQKRCNAVYIIFASDKRGVHYKDVQSCTGRLLPALIPEEQSLNADAASRNMFSACDDGININSFRLCSTIP